MTGILPLTVVARPAARTLTPVVAALACCCCRRRRKCLVAVCARRQSCQFISIKSVTNPTVEAGIESAASGQLVLLRACTCWVRAAGRGEIAVEASESLGTVVALVSAGRHILAGGIVFAGLVRGTVIEILVAQNAAPILVAQTLARRQAVAVLAAGIGEALVAARTRPAGPTPAAVGRIALVCLAAGPTLGLQTVVLLALPALEADLLAARRTLVVAKLVVARPTERVAAVAVIIRRAVESFGV